MIFVRTTARRQSRPRTKILIGDIGLLAPGYAALGGDLT
jgi:hypothetical protein